jgi:hypothetical protein
MEPRKRITSKRKQAEASSIRDKTDGMMKSMELLVKKIL